MVFPERIRLGSKGFLTVVLIVLVIIAAFEMRHVGAHMWTYKGETQRSRVHLDVSKLNEASFRFRRTDRKDSIALGPNFGVGVLPNWYFSRYVKFLKETDDELQARRKNHRQ